MFSAYNLQEKRQVPAVNAPGKFLRRNVQYEDIPAGSYIIVFG